jgi:hypothetical protein
MPGYRGFLVFSSLANATTARITWNTVAMAFAPRPAPAISSISGLTVMLSTLDRGRLPIRGRIHLFSVLCQFCKVAGLQGFLFRFSMCSSHFADCCLNVSPTITACTVLKSSSEFAPLSAIISAAFLVRSGFDIEPGPEIGHTRTLRCARFSEPTTSCQNRTTQESPIAWDKDFLDLPIVNAKREIDLHPKLAEMLKAFIGDRDSGFLFRSTVGSPLSKTNVLRRNLHPILKEIGWCDPKTKETKTGFHAFRRFRVTWLRKGRAPEDLLRYWIGHSNESITSGYSMVKADVAFRKKEAEELGFGFELSSGNPDLIPNAPICTQSVLISEVA